MTDIKIHFFTKEFRFAKLSIVYDKFSKIMDYRTFFETDLRKNGLLTQSLKKRVNLISILFILNLMTLVVISLLFIIL